MIAAGISVISSQQARNETGSRAQNTPANASTSAAVNTPTVRPRRDGSKYPRENTSAGPAISPSVPRKNPLSPSTPTRGRSALVNP